MNLRNIIQGLKRKAYADMNRIADGWDPKERLSDRAAGSGEKACPLSFSSKSRKKLGWTSYLCGLGH